MANTVHVTNISANTKDEEIRDFFNFWYVLPIPRKTSWSKENS